MFKFGLNLGSFDSDETYCYEKDCSGISKETGRTDLSVQIGTDGEVGYNLVQNLICSKCNTINRQIIEFNSDNIPAYWDYRDIFLLSHKTQNVWKVTGESKEQWLAWIEQKTFLSVFSLLEEVHQKTNNLNMVANFSGENYKNHLILPSVCLHGYKSEIHTPQGNVFLIGEEENNFRQALNAAKNLIDETEDPLQLEQVVNSKIKSEAELILPKRLMFFDRLLENEKLVLRQIAMTLLMYSSQTGSTKIIEPYLHSAFNLTKAFLAKSLNTLAEQEIFTFNKHPTPDYFPTSYYIGAAWLNFDDTFNELEIKSFLDGQIHQGVKGYNATLGNLVEMYENSSTYQHKNGLIISHQLEQKYPQYHSRWTQEKGWIHHVYRTPEIAEKICNQPLSWKDYVEFCKLYVPNPEKFEYQGFEFILQPNYNGYLMCWYASTNLEEKFELNTWIHKEKKEAIASAKNLIDLGNRDFLEKQIIQAQNNKTGSTSLFFNSKQNIQKYTDIAKANHNTNRKF